MELVFIALRNVFRNKRRSILNIIALSIGISIMIIGMGWVRGYYNILFKGMINFDTGHLQLLPPGYMEEKRRMPLDIAIDNPQEVMADLEDFEHVADLTARIDFTMELTNGYEGVPTMARGIIPEREAQITVLKHQIVEGEYLDEDGGVLIGKPLAEKMNIQVGDQVFLSAFTKYSKNNLDSSTVRGIFSFGYPVLDNNMVFVDLPKAQDLLRMKNQATKLVVKLDQDWISADTVEKLNQSLNDQIIVAFDWQEFAKVMVSGVKADMGGFYFLLLVIYLFIIIGILNSMSMSVHDRMQEIGTLRAIGIKKSQMTRIFLYESIWLGLISAAFGIIMGGMAAYYIQFIGFDVTEILPETMPIPFGERLTGDFQLMDFIWSTVIGVLTAMAGTIFPARRAAKINIADTMRMSM